MFYDQAIFPSVARLSRSIDRHPSTLAP